MEQSELVVQPPNTTEFPYMQILEEFYKKCVFKKLFFKKNFFRQREIENSNKHSGVQFFYDMDANLEEEDKVDRGGRRKRPWQNSDNALSQSKQNFELEACWFCLSNADDNKHLIVSVGSTCYAAMPKGPLCDDHMLIMSIGKFL